MIEISDEIGTLVISLDFELYWGVRDKRPLDQYRRNLEGVHEAVPAILELFRRHRVHATWATVGFVMMESFDEVCASRPEALPGYSRLALCPYTYAEQVRGNQDPAFVRCHFAPQLVERVFKSPDQEIATHTLSHFYCLEAPRSVDAFAADLERAAEIAERKLGARPTALVFPRNQYSPAHIDLARAAGLIAVRGNPPTWMYEPRPGKEETRLRRAARLLDAYLPLSSSLSYPLATSRVGSPANVPASRFLRPWSRRSRRAEELRCRRIRGELTRAAERGEVYHLWWHPHNFGVHLEENLGVLSSILEAYSDLAAAGRMRSLNMSEVASLPN